MGERLDTTLVPTEAYVRGRPGDRVELTVERAVEPKPLILHGVFRTTALAGASEGLARSSALQITGSFPIPFLLVGFAVLFLRLEEPHAWLLALLFCAFVATPGFSNPLAVSPPLRAFVLVFRAVFRDAVSAFLSFFRSLPAAITSGSALAVVEMGGARVRNLYSHSRFADWRAKPSTSGSPPGRQPQRRCHRTSLKYALLALGMISLAQNSFMATVPPEARRKSRVILWGTVAGVLPVVLVRARRGFRRISPLFLGRYRAGAGVVPRIPSPLLMRW